MNIYNSDGDYREYLYRNKKIIFKHTTNRKALGKDNISERDIKRLAFYAERIKEDLKKDTLKLPFWIQEVLKKIQETIHE